MFSLSHSEVFFVGYLIHHKIIKFFHLVQISGKWWQLIVSSISS